MTPSFIPVIGSSFDALAGQQAGWANYNRGVDEANMGRAAAAEQTRNNWLAQVQQLQQQQADRQYQADQRSESNAISLAQQARADQEARREFDVSAGIKRAAITAKVDATNKAQQDANQQAENYATTTADELHDVASKAERSLTEKTDAQGEMAKGIAEWSAKVPQAKVTLNKTGTMFVQRPNVALSTDEKDQVDRANADLAEKFSTLKEAETTHADASKSFAQLVKESGVYGLAARKKGDTWGLYHSGLNKWYLPKAKAPTTATGNSDETPTVPAWFGAQSTPPMFGAPAQTWPGGAPAGMAPASPQTLQIGKYAVRAE